MTIVFCPLADSTRSERNASRGKRTHPRESETVRVSSTENDNERRTMRIYRFRDKVAVNPSEGPTFYLDADDANAIADALAKVAKDIGECGFTDSEVGTIEIEAPEDKNA